MPKRWLHHLYEALLLYGDGLRLQVLNTAPNYQQGQADTDK